MKIMDENVVKARLARVGITKKNIRRICRMPSLVIFYPIFPPENMESEYAMVYFVLWMAKIFIVIALQNLTYRFWYEYYGINQAIALLYALVSFIPYSLLLYILYITPGVIYSLSTGVVDKVVSVVRKTYDLYERYVPEEGRKPAKLKNHFPGEDSDVDDKNTLQEFKWQGKKMTRDKK
jgi:hypothetical protein